MQQLRATRTSTTSAAMSFVATTPLYPCRRWSGSQTRDVKHSSRGIDYTIPCHTIQYHTIPCHAIPYHAYHTIPYNTIPYHAIPHHTIPCNVIPYHTIPYHTIPYHTIPYNTTSYDATSYIPRHPYSPVMGRVARLRETHYPQQTWSRVGAVPFVRYPRLISAVEMDCQHFALHSICTILR